ncbi:hypothetical protein APHAL10511_003644 [Amanita phalloides]|nr:hypothetical protein APHAL10511_003644 [Amanita phalloides]
MFPLIHLPEALYTPYHCPLAKLVPNPFIKLPHPPVDLPPELWLEIFQFCTHVHREASIVPLDPFAPRHVSTNVMAPNSPSMSLRTKLSLVLVCRSWREIAMPLLYRYVVIRSPSRANALLDVLRSSFRRTKIMDKHATLGGYGYWTKHIEIYTHARGAHTLQFLQTLFYIFQYCPNLDILAGSWNHDLPLEFTNSITRLYGQTLQGLCWSEQRPHSPDLYDTVASPNFMATFRNLRALDLRHIIGRSPIEYEKDGRPLMPHVQDLILSTYTRSLQAATALQLPSLRNLIIQPLKLGNTAGYFIRALLHVHGASLVTVDLRLPSQDLDYDLGYSGTWRNVDYIDPNLFFEDGMCPCLTTFTYPISSPVPNVSAHSGLRRIGLRGVRADTLYPHKETVTKAHLMAITPIRYPKLEVVRTVGFLVEADMDGLVKDVFIWWVERFERHGIDFLDGEGVLWTYADSEGMQKG